MLDSNVKKTMGDNDIINSTYKVRIAPNNLHASFSFRQSQRRMYKLSIFLAGSRSDLNDRVLDHEFTEEGPVWGKKASFSRQNLI